MTTADEQIVGVAGRVTDLIERGQLPAAVMLLAGLHPADQADVVIELDEDDQRRLVEALTPSQLAAVLEYLESENRSELVEDLSPGQLAPALDLMEDDDAADLLQDMEPAQARAVLARMTDADDVAPLLDHEEDSAGGLMTRGFVSLREGMTAQQAIGELRRLKPDADTSYYLYVTDAQGRLRGVLGIRDLIVADPLTRVATIMRADVHRVREDTDQEECARLISHYDLLALPVVDADDRLIGVLTVDDLIDVVEEEATEDMYRLAGIQGEESIFRSVPSSVRRRLPWLYINMGTAFVAATTVAMFEGTIAEHAILAALMPIVAGIGGNAGTQTLTILVRGMALGDISPRDIFVAWRKEVLVGLTMGLAIGTVLAFVVTLVTGNSTLGLVVGAALLLNLLAATSAGVCVPLTLRSLRVDPALASSVFTTMVTDVFGFFIFLSLATVFISKI
ncbi:MAG: magnesium transporter [Dehalococcoidia bacterium]